MKIYRKLAAEEDGCFIRVKIEEISQKDFNGSPKTVRLFGLDSGEFYTRNINDHLYVLPKEFEALPGFAIELIVANMKPTLGERRHRREYTNRAKTLTDRKVLRGKVRNNQCEFLYQKSLKYICICR